MLALAPMEDVTDTVFRQIVASVAKPDLMFTEFANVDAVLHGDIQRLRFTPIEYPIVAQIWGSDPAKFAAAAKIVAQMGFDGVDINLGCPIIKIIKTGGCAALIGQNKLVSEIIAATVEAGLPVSVKTRLGIKKIITAEWFGFLLTQKLSAITIHARTASEKSDVPAHWDEIAKAVVMKGMSKTLVIGNGDVKTYGQAQEYMQKYGVDGVMIGRGIFDNIGIFGNITLTTQEKVELFLKHVELFEKTWGKTKNFAILKKFSKTYINGFDGASKIREQVSAARDYAGLKSKLRELIQ